VSSQDPAGTYARQLANRLLIDLSWNSSRLEGNTYSLLETERLISAGEVATGKNALEAQMILNHKGAIEFLIDSADEIGFNRYTLLNLHALLCDNLLDDPTASGRLRTIPVGIGHTTFLPLEGPQRIEECFDQVMDTATAIRDPFEQAFFAMVHLPYLQPFVDVNKRVSRLAANIPLIQRNLCPLSFVDVSQATYISAMLGVYEFNRIDLLRDVFVWAYKRSCARYSAVRQSLGEPDPFRLQYREQFTQLVAEVVRKKMNKPQAVEYIQVFVSQQIQASDRERFIEVVDDQLLSLHEGNIARYRLRSGEFFGWRETWH
jgi:Fic family protein